MPRKRKKSILKKLDDAALQKNVEVVMRYDIGDGVRHEYVIAKGMNAVFNAFGSILINKLGQYLISEMQESIEVKKK